MDQWDFLLSVDSAENFPWVLLMMLIFSALGALLAFCEHRLRGKWIWLAANAVLTTVAVAVFLALGAGLSELLLYLLLFLFIRLCFVFWEGRGNA